MRNFSRIYADEFQETLNRLNLMDLSLAKGKCTRFNKKSKPACSKIDRFLVSMNCQLECSKLCQTLLRRTIADNFCRDSGGIKWGLSLSYLRINDLK